MPTIDEINDMFADASKEEKKKLWEERRQGMADVRNDSFLRGARHGVDAGKEVITPVILDHKTTSVRPKLNVELDFAAIERAVAKFKKEQEEKLLAIDIETDGLTEKWKESKLTLEKIYGSHIEAVGTERDLTIGVDLGFKKDEAVVAVWESRTEMSQHILDVETPWDGIFDERKKAEEHPRCCDDPKLELYRYDSGKFYCRSCGDLTTVEDIEECACADTDDVLLDDWDGESLYCNTCGDRVLYSFEE